MLALLLLACTPAPTRPSTNEPFLPPEAEHPEDTGTYGGGDGFDDDPTGGDGTGDDGGGADDGGGDDGGGGGSGDTVFDDTVARSSCPTS
jgi:hypothetical protein